MAVGATTGPSPALSVWTWVSATLNGVVTVTAGAAVSVDPVTATLPVVPGNVHSGVPPAAGAAVGQAPAAVCVMGDSVTWAADGDGVLVDAVVASEPHAASVTTSDAAQATSPMEEDIREKFTVVTLQPHHPGFAGSPKPAPDRRSSRGARGKSALTSDTRNASMARAAKRLADASRPDGGVDAKPRPASRTSTRSSITKSRRSPPAAARGERAMNA